MVYVARDEEGVALGAHAQLDSLALDPHHFDGAAGRRAGLDRGRSFLEQGGSARLEAASVGKAPGADRRVDLGRGERSRVRDEPRARERAEVLEPRCSGDARDGAPAL
jgi:hypothetical protein